MANPNQSKDQADKSSQQAERSRFGGAKVTGRDWLSYLAITMLMAYLSYLLLAIWCSFHAVPLPVTRRFRYSEST